MVRLIRLFVICVTVFGAEYAHADQNTSLLSQLGVGVDTCTEMLDKEGNLVALARRHDGCVLIDVSDPENPSIITTINPDDRANNALPSIDIWDVQIHNGYLYLMNRPEEVDPVLNNWVGLYIYNIASPASPTLEGWLLWGGGIYHHLAGSVQSGAVEDIFGVPHAFLCSDITGDVEIFDVSAVSAPVYKSSVLSPGYFTESSEVVIADNYLYSAWGSGGFTIHDVTIPSAPFQRVHQPYIGDPVINGGLRTLCPTPDGQCLITGEYTLGGDVRLWDISDFNSVQLMDSWRLNSGALLWTVRATSDFAFVAHLEDGVQVLDIRDQTTLKPVGCYDPDSGAPATTWAGIPDVVIEGTGVFASHQADGFYVIDFGDEVVVTKAEWKKKKKQLKVYATSTGQPDVELELIGYGPMTWNNKRKRYQLTVSGVTANPGIVTVMSDLTGFDDRIVQVR